MSRYMMISQDCHGGAPWYIYRTYLDPEYRADYDDWISSYLAGATRLNESEMQAEKPMQFDSQSPARQLEYLEAMERSKGHLGNWDPEVRARELDREGIAGEVIFPDGSQKNYPPFGAGGFVLIEKSQASHRQRLAGCRAHNRWLAEFCQTNKGRHAGVALVTMENPEDAVAEIRWAREHGLFGGVLLPPLQLFTDGPESFWHHPRYEPVWQVCSELDMPINTHVSKSEVNYGGPPIMRLAENIFVSYRPFWYLLWGGVFERYPTFKFCPTESGGMQALWFNSFFDFIAKDRRPEEVKKAISGTPSDYWYRHCYVGASANSSRYEIDARDKIGVRNILWGSDYPHPEGTWPKSIERTRALFSGVPEDEVRLMIGGNAARVYGFDLERMNSIAETIGPEVAEIGA